MRRLLPAIALLATPGIALGQIVPPQPVERPAPDVGRLDTLTADGRVVVWVRVTEQGTVDSSRVGTHLTPRLDSAAEAAARRWRFTPATRDGSPTAMWTRASFRFGRPESTARDSVRAPAPAGPAAPAPLTRSASNASSLPRVEPVGAETCQVLTPPQPIRPQAPRIPDDLIRVGGNGVVRVRALVNAAGRVAEMTVVETFDARFERVATETIARWQFTPARCDDRDIPVYVTIPVRFRIPTPPGAPTFINGRGQ